jgi:hypothetical protein
MTMANGKPATQKPRKRMSSGSSNGSAPKARKSSSGRSSAGSAQKSKSTASARGNASKSQSRSGGSATKSKSKSKSRATGASAAKRAASPTATEGMGVAGTAKQVAGKAKGPALAVGAAAAGIVGGLALKSRLTRPKVLGVSLPRSLKPSSLDAKSLAKTVGDASQRFAKTSKSVSRDIERAGDRAERIGKILS